MRLILWLRRMLPEKEIIRALRLWRS